MIERLYIDMDETMVDLCTKWSYYHRNRYGSDFTRDTVPYGRAEDEKEGNQWIDFLRIPGFMADLPFIERSTQEVLEYLAQTHRIVPVTRAVAWESARDKYSWVHTHLRIPGIVRSMADLHITGAKGDLDPTNSVLIDDDPKNLQAFAGHTICYARPWNEEYRRSLLLCDSIKRPYADVVWTRKYGDMRWGDMLSGWMESWDHVIFVLGRMLGELADKALAAEEAGRGVDV